ncbi:8-amino-7-oxononanoate synthase [Coprinopsis cinerea okayama7|uniref:8-amino-7-oxononanoate synthase n=1 Tax=Coprinopsis cinerea (strain Okayama-7 / 130 / ATCC MYA-4618 / FGSC 9003) TaxID=240176 RepID=A8NVG2_COPC7|nr:8-amino-7-oxononanoate synthase [Coprinopsis cinerea okayama7\|eukprot:XP_001836705.2 8-amino-7-oxononanoate synthase [Coprinopsis cinerea okayama7\
MLNTSKNGESALASREKRLIRRRLPDPNLHISASSSSITSNSSNNNDNNAKPQSIIDFTSNDYLSLSLSPLLRAHFLHKLTTAPDILGSGGSRLLVNTPTHQSLENRLREFFHSPAALLFNSGFDANVGFFACVPQEGDAIVYDEYIHASVHDGMRSSRVDPKLRLSFAHNNLRDLRRVLESLLQAQTPDSDYGRRFREGRSTVFLSVESLYSMDGTFAPLREMVGLLEEVFPRGNAYLVVDEAHATGVYGPAGRGRVAMAGLEGHERVLALLVTFGKALAATGAVILTTPLIKDYLLNYARSLIYTTSLSSAAIIAADASFDMLQNGVADQLAKKLFSLSTYLVETLQRKLEERGVPRSVVGLPGHLVDWESTVISSPSPLESASRPELPNTKDPTPIIPLLTPHPRPLSAYLLTHLRINARPITWPTVPKGKDRVRICLHAGNTKEEVDRLVKGVVEWAESVIREERNQGVVKGRRGNGGVGGVGSEVAVASKL